MKPAKDLVIGDKIQMKSGIVEIVKVHVRGAYASQNKSVNNMYFEGSKIVYDYKKQNGCIGQGWEYPNKLVNVI